MPNTNQIIETELRKEIIEASKSCVELFIDEFLEDCQYELNDSDLDTLDQDITVTTENDYYECSISSAMLFDRYRKWCANNEFRCKNKIAMARAVSRDDRFTKYRKKAERGFSFQISVE